MTSVWVYDTAAHGIGKLASASITAGIDTGYQRVYSYDSAGPPAAGRDHHRRHDLHHGGQLRRQRPARHRSPIRPASPSPIVYTSLGYAQQLKNTLSGQVYWTANALDAEQHLTQQTAGNGVVTSAGFNATTGRLSSILAGTGSATASQNFTYTYDSLGNLLTRADVNTGLSESFIYDPLNRLTSATVGRRARRRPSATTAIGNITAKSDVGTYTYPRGGPAASRMPS